MLSIIVPCYNGQKQIENKNIQKIIFYMNRLNIQYEIIVVDDGSKDNSLTLLKELESNNKNLKILSYPVNKGKGFAVRTGIKESKGDIIFMDIDLATQLCSIEMVLTNKDKYDVIIGSRDLPDSIGGHDKPFLRNIMSSVSKFMVKFLTDVDNTDTQCGFKYLSRKTIDIIYDKLIIDRWAFDVEYLYLSKINNLKVLEIPVEWINDKDSSVSPIKSSINFIKDLLKIRKNRNIYNNL